MGQVVVDMAARINRYRKSPRLRQHWRRERLDLVRLLLTPILVLVVWLLLGWNWHVSVAHGDLKAQLHWYDILARGGGWWQNVRYDPLPLGGVPLHDAFGTQPITQLFVWLGFRDLSVANLLVMFVQCCWGFLGVTWVRDLQARFSAARPVPRGLVDWATDLTLIGIFAFAPALGVRVAVFHHNLLFGAAAFLVASVALTRQRHDWSITLLGALVFCLLNILSTFGHQTVVYSLVFGAPTFLALVFWHLPDRSERRSTRDIATARLRHFALPAAVVIIASMLVAPRFWPMLQHALSSDFPRFDQQVYPWLDTRFYAPEWLRTVVWHSDLVVAGRGHERLYPIGPILLGLLVVPWKRLPGGRWSFAVTLVALLLFTLKLEPLATGFVQGVPALQKFQIASRALLIFVPLVLGLGLTGWLLLMESEATAPSSWRKDFAFGLIVVIGAAFCFSADPTKREIIAWSVPGFWLLGRRRWSSWQIKRFGLGVLAVVFAGSVAAFASHLPRQPMTRQQLVDAPAAQGQRLRQQLQSLQSSLRRVHLRHHHPYYGTNTAAAMGIASSSGYSNLTSRMRRLLEALRSKSLPTATGWWAGAGKEHALFSGMYNVEADLFYRRHRTEVRAREGATGPAWFAPSIARVNDFQALITSLTPTPPAAPAPPPTTKAPGASAGKPSPVAIEAPALTTEAVSRRLQQKIVVVASDPLAGRYPKGPLSPHCSGAMITSIEPIQGQHWRLQVRSPADCLLTISSNFLESRLAFDQDGRRLVTLPVYGTLQGVVVTAGTTVVNLRPNPVPKPLILMPWLAVLLLVLVAWALGRNAEPGGLAADVDINKA